MIAVSCALRTFKHCADGMCHTRILASALAVTAISLRETDEDEVSASMKKVVIYFFEVVNNVCDFLLMTFESCHDLFAVSVEDDRLSIVTA